MDKDVQLLIDWLERIESKVDRLSQQVWFIYGSASALALVISAAVSYILK